MEITLDSLDFNTIRIKDESGNYVDINLQEELAINESNLEQEMIEQPSKYIYWSSILERLKLFQEGVELELESTVAELDQEARGTMEKPTKDSVDAYIKRTEKYKLAKERLLHYEYLVRWTGRVVKAFEQRKDLMQSYGRQLAHDRQYGSGAGSKLVDNYWQGGYQNPNLGQNYNYNQGG